MAKAKSPSGRRTQTVQPAIAGAAVATDAALPKKRTSIPQFASQVRAEGRKIVWPSRKETWITSVMVLIMVTATALFFFLADLAMSWGVNMILKIAS